MSSPKESFQKNKDLFPWWKAIVEDPKFAMMTLYARSELLSHSPSKEFTSGALDYHMILESLAEVADSSTPMPSPGLHHMAEVLPDKPHHD